MSEPTPPKSGKAAAAAAAKTLLADRIALVNTLGTPSTYTANRTRQQPKPATPSTKQPKPRAPPTPAH